MDYALLNPETNTAATFTFTVTRRVMANFSCQVVGIIENEDPVIYFCNPNETNMYYNYLKPLFLIMIIPLKILVAHLLF
ncbi:MAG: hypothetical protein ACLU5J_06685 [Christensenellales bacterium]